MTTKQPQTAVAAAFANAADMLSLYAAVTIGPVGNGESISVMMVPGTGRTLYFDGASRQRISLLLICASRSRLKAAEAAAKLYNAAPEFLLSVDGADVQRIVPLSPPQEAGAEPDGRIIFSATVAVDFTTKG